MCVYETLGMIVKYLWKHILRRVGYKVSLRPRSLAEFNVYEGEMGLKNYGNIFKDLWAGLGLQVQNSFKDEASSQVDKLSTINES